ncbi:MAG: HD domain-containing protein [Prevotellaceae bacterium]|jgi:HD superfamily phosphohydrolase|nr:HD domain-containing protein [Prevotellaceae bacterium]
MKKTKIVNDPVHGFITVRSPLVYSLLEQPCVQRLRSIKQLGLTHLVYPGACHNRLQHALGATSLMERALDVLKSKGHTIDKDEFDGALAAILLHDLGHGPFSHTLELSIVDVHHETVSMLLIEQLNRQMNGALDAAIEIFSKRHRKQFLNELVSGQLDMDRLDYLRRDSFFSGVVEGMVGLERIINMLDVDDDRLVVEAKGLYSVENFLISRRLMYWQVYLHKTVLSAEHVMNMILRRARYLVGNGDKELFASPALAFFLNNRLNADEFAANPEALANFALLTDSDVECAASVWTQHRDRVLSLLCRMLLHRRLPRTELNAEPFEQWMVEDKKSLVRRKLKLTDEESDYFVCSRMVSNTGYSTAHNQILIKNRNGSLNDIYDASDMLRHSNFNEETHKYMLCYMKEQFFSD